MNDDDIFSFKSLRRSRQSIVCETEYTNFAEEDWSQERSPKKFLSKSIINSELEMKQKPVLSKTSYDGKQKAIRQKRVAAKDISTGKQRRGEGKKRSIFVELEKTECSNLSGGTEKLNFQKMHVALPGGCKNDSAEDNQESQFRLSESASREATKKTFSIFSLPSKIGLDQKHKDDSAGQTSYNRMIKKSTGRDGSQGIDGRCPFCQMPFSVLKLESPNSHTMECMDIPLKTTEECPAGLSCVSTIPSHYRRFLHSHLALHLAGLGESKEKSCKDHLSPDKPFKGIVECQRNRGDIRSPTKWKQTCLGDACSGSVVYLSPEAKEGDSQSLSADGSEAVVEESLDIMTGSQTETGVCDGENSCVMEPLIEAEPEGADLEISSQEHDVSTNAGGFLIEADDIDSMDKHLNDDAANILDIAKIDNSSAGNSFDKSVILDGVSVASLKMTTASSPQESSKFSELPQTSLHKQTSLLSFFQTKGHTIKQRQSLTAGKSSILKGLSLRVDQKIQYASDHHPKRSLPKCASEPVVTVVSPAVCSLSTSMQTASRNGSRGNSDVADVMPTVEGRVSGRQCPFYKKIPGTKITVDAFSYGEIVGCEAYVLTHFHSDHYKGLTKRFSQPIFCSPVTGNLVEKQLGVSGCWINRLPLNKPCQVTGVWLTLMEANHCPGAVIVLFELPDGKKILHTGDFRADPSMESYPSLTGIGIDELYLDTTYCDAAYTFPPQSAVVKFAVDTTLKAVEKDPRTLVVCGAYTIGKERIFAALAEALESKVCVQAAKKRVLDSLDDPNLKNKVSTTWSDGRVHVLPMGQLNPKSLEAHRQKCPQFTTVLAFEPTGWTHTKNCLVMENIQPKYARHGVTIYGIPYSEHSSFLELKRFVQFIQPKKIIPTVNNGSPAARKKMEVIFKQWLSEQNVPNSTAEFSRRSSQQSLGSWLSLKNY